VVDSAGQIENLRYAFAMQKQAEHAELAPALSAYSARLARINALEPAMAALSDELLRKKTAEFRQRLVDAALRAP
jgi:preprotein translocase subunit SecA